jgi:hypothetical protein
MAERTGPTTTTGEYPRVELVEVEPPGRQTEITWLAIKEGLRELFVSNVDGQGTPAIVVLPHRIQAIFVCRGGCMKSAVVKYYTADAVRGHIAYTRRCECGNEMYRRFLGADKDVPIEVDSSPAKPEGLEAFFEVYESSVDDGDEDEDLIDQ